MKRLFFTLFILSTANLFGQDLKKNKLDELFKKVEETHSEAIILYKDNKLISEKYFGVGNPDTLIEAMSCTKSIVGLAMACLLTDRIIESLDIPV